MQTESRKIKKQDINKRKLGLELLLMIFVLPNNTEREIDQINRQIDTDLGIKLNVMITNSVTPFEHKLCKCIYMFKLTVK